VVKEKFKAKNRCIWGGVSGPLTVEQGTEEDTEEAVIQAMQTLGKGGGFILSPVDNVRDDTPNAWKNTYKFLETWKKHRQEYI
jgi:uroporphyrinogen decarboxylase